MVSNSFKFWFAYNELIIILYTPFLRIRYRVNKNGGYSIRKRKW